MSQLHEAIGRFRSIIEMTTTTYGKHTPTARRTRVAVAKFKPAKAAGHAAIAQHKMGQAVAVKQKAAADRMKMMKH